MGSLINRGNKAAPKWYAKYKEASGEWKRVPTGQPTKALAQQYLATIEARVAMGLVGVEPRTGAGPLCKELMAQWTDSLTNRDAHNDRSRVNNHILPWFGHREVTAVDLPTVLEWLDEQRKAGNLAESTIRHNLNILSRFFGWAILRGKATVNPVRQIPAGHRPQQAPKEQDAPWLEDETVARELFRRIKEPVNFMFYIGNRSGLRSGEIAGLRMADMAFLNEHVIRVRFSYNGPLKEDKGKGHRKVKWVPAPVDWKEVLSPWLSRREAEGATPECLVFPRVRLRDLNAAATKGVAPVVTKRFMIFHFRAVADELGLEMTWYQATRHSFVSRCLRAGASLDEVSAAVGHSSTLVTRRFYDHYIRKSFSPILRSGIGSTEPGGEDHPATKANPSADPNTGDLPS